MLCFFFFLSIIFTFSHLLFLISFLRFHRDLMNVIKENNVIVVVGETGSGKVCIVKNRVLWWKIYIYPLLPFFSPSLRCYDVYIFSLLDNSIDSVPCGRGIHQLWKNRLHTATSCCCCFCRETCIRRDELQSRIHSWILHSIWGRFFFLQKNKIKK